MLLPRKADDLSVDWSGSPCPYLPATDGNDCPLHLAILVEIRGFIAYSSAMKSGPKCSIVEAPRYADKLLVE